MCVLSFCSCLKMSTDRYDFQTEISPPAIRGFIVGLSQQMLGIGFIVANWVSGYKTLHSLTVHSLLWMYRLVMAASF